MGRIGFTTPWTPLRLVKSIEAWKASTAAERRFTLKLPKGDAEAATLLSLPWELIHDDEGFRFQGKRGVRVRRSLPNKQRRSVLATEPPIRVLLVSPRPEDDSAAYRPSRQRQAPGGSSFPVGRFAGSQAP
jgi:hypothetical protein